MLRWESLLEVVVLTWALGVLFHYYYYGKHRYVDVFIGVLKGEF